MWPRTQPPAGTPDSALCPHISVGGGHCEGWGSPTFPRCAVDKWLLLLPLLPPTECILGAHPLLLSRPSSLRPSSLRGPNPRSIVAEQWLEEKAGPEAVMRQMGNHGWPCFQTKGPHTGGRAPESGPNAAIASLAPQLTQRDGQLHLPCKRPGKMQPPREAVTTSRHLGASI